MFLGRVFVSEDLHQISRTEGGMQTMLGEQLSEGSGKITAIRVLVSDGPTPKLEISLQGSGKLLGMDMNVFGTYRQTLRSGGVLYGEGQSVAIITGGDMATWTGFGIGRPTGPVPAATFSVCGSFQTASKKLARLNTVATVIEQQVDENGNVAWKMWEWKEPSPLS
jgi:hypothetical protein